MKYYLFVFFIWLIGVILGYSLKIEVNSSLSYNFVQETHDNYSIFVNNIKLSLLNLVGAASFGLYSIMSLFYNSILNGILIKEIRGMNISLWMYLRYAVFENLGMLLSCKLGIEFGHLFYIYFFYDFPPAILVRWFRLSIELLLILFFIFVGAMFEV